MVPGKKPLMVILFLFVLTGFSKSSFAVKSVYVIADTGTGAYSISKIQAYRINGNSLEYQTLYNCQYPLAVGLAIDSESQILFVTHEDYYFPNLGKTIEIVNAKTMQYIDKVTAPGADDLAGIAMDKSKSKLYAVDRYTNQLYSWSWNPSNKKLTPDFNDPYYIMLEDLTSGWPYGAFGIALDEAHSRLYVADNTEYIKYYSTNDWSKEEEISVSCNVISVAIDVNNQLLYYGSMGGYGDGDPYLYKYNISTHAESSVYLGSDDCSVAGIAVDQETSLVYITTFGGSGDWYPNPPQDRLMVYNSGLQRLWYSGDIGNPAGVAVAANVGYKEPLFSITKDNNDVQNNCVHTDDLVTFNIHWDANGHNDTNVKVIDYLPPDLDYYSSEPPVNDYNSTTKKYIWELGTLTGTESDTFKITARVKSLSCPCGKLTNTSCLEGDTYLSEATADVNACSWSEGIVYVDKDATGGYKNGTNWNNAYTDLQEAFAAGQDCEGFKAVWVASGTYQPTQNPAETDASFELVGGVDLLGHFAGFEASPDERDFTNPDNETVLDGLIDPENGGRANDIIKGNSVNDVVIDGFTIQSAGYRGIYLYDSNIVIMDCIIENHDSSGAYGAYSDSGSLKINGSIIRNNGSSGVYSYSGSLTINGSIIRNNGSNGIDLSNNSATTIINNWIYNNSGVGIMLWAVDPRYVSTIRNNTIYGNAYGIQLNWGWGTSLIIRNCIIRENTSGDLSSNISNVNYCCLQNTHSGFGNFVADPCFYNADANNFHLTYNSPCKNAGDPAGSYGDETDIDGEPRIKYGQVDIGADEFFSADFDESGIVDFIDYAILANAWWTQTGDSNYNDICDLADNGIIDVGDLELFCKDWLWQQGGESGWMFGDEGGEKMMMEDNEALPAEITLTEADVKEILEWTDAIEAELVEAGLSLEGYDAFRQALEEDLLRTLESAAADK